MSIIKLLPENLVNQIAAGEVVERPASVVKELVENSLDAGAKKVVVEIQEAGSKLIKITDDGCGMAREDLKMSLQRHATSKISKEADLWEIVSMGFRGEALASISSVSKLSIRSRRREDEVGTELDCDGGDAVRLQDTGMAHGTQVFVYDLFFNTPARKKYLKKASTEMGHITHTLNTVALANPEVAFKLASDEKVVFDLAPATDLISRIADIFGKTTADAMIPIFYGSSEFKFNGFIGKPLLARSSAKHQYFFVNGRPIQQFAFAATIKRAYHSMLMENKKPMFLINIEVDPSLIDVNVHPRKLEIRFEQEKEMMSALYGCTKTALEKVSLIPKGFTESQHYMSDRLPVMGRSVSAGNNFSPRKASTGSVQEAISFSREIVQDAPVMPVERESAGLEEKPKIKAITQVANSYIVAEDQDGLVLIDQHAAHERVRYEELMEQFEKQDKKVQPLLVPAELVLTNDELSVIEENKQVFDALGFEISAFGGKSFVVNAVPACLAGERVDDVVKGVVDDILEGKKASKFQGHIEEILTYMSCRSAIKFGQSLTITEMQALIRQMENLKRPYTCPHGRPTMIALNFGELEKMFGRK